MAAPATTPTAATAASEPITYVSEPHWHIPFSVWLYEPYVGDSQINRIYPDGTHRTVLLRKAIDPAYSRSGGQIAYAREDRTRRYVNIYVAHADGRGQYQVTHGDYDQQPSWSPDGSHLAFMKPGAGLFSVPTNGRGERQLTRTFEDRDPAWGPNGQIAFARIQRGLWHIYLMNSDGGDVRQLTTGPTSDRAPSWSPDGSTIAFQSESIDRIDIYTIRADGTGLRRVTFVAPDEANQQPSWSPDGTAIAYTAWGPFGLDSEIMTIDLRTGAKRLLTNDGGEDMDPTWSPGAAARSRASASRPSHNMKLASAMSLLAPPGAIDRARSPLSRKRKPPAGLKAWISHPVGGDGSDCMGLHDVPPWYMGPIVTFSSHQSRLEAYHGGRLEAGTRGFYCLYRFSRARSAGTPRLSLIAPSGQSITLKLTLEDSLTRTWLASWIALPRTEGRYSVIATQGKLSATTSFLVVPPVSPHLLVLDTQHAPEPVQSLGRPLTIVITGLRPNARFALDLYRRAGKPGLQTFRYFNSIDLRARADGTRLYSLSTSTSDVAGVYWVALRLRKNPLDFGCFTVVHRLHKVDACTSTTNPLGGSP